MYVQPTICTVLVLYAITSMAPKKSIRVESRASSQKSFRKEWRQVLACDLLNDGFYHVARSLRDPTGLLDLLLDKVRFSFRADTLTSGPCTSYNQVPVFVFAAAASTHQAHLLCTSTLGALPRLAICGAPWCPINQSELANSVAEGQYCPRCSTHGRELRLHCMSTYSTGRSTQAPFHPDATDAHCSMYMDLTLCQRTATPQVENVVEATAGGSGLPPGRTRAAPNVQH